MKNGVQADSVTDMRCTCYAHSACECICGAWGSPENKKLLREYHRGYLAGLEKAKEWIKEFSGPVRSANFESASCILDTTCLMNIIESEIKKGE